MTLTAWQFHEQVVGATDIGSYSAREIGVVYMYLVWLATALTVAKWLEIGPVTALSWWWILAMFGCAFVWFEGIERLFGRDKRQVEAADYEKRAKERLEEQFGHLKIGARKSRR